jgi:hypothetical protein
MGEGRGLEKSRTLTPREDPHTGPRLPCQLRLQPKSSPLSRRDLSRSSPTFSLPLVPGLRSRIIVAQFNYLGARAPFLSSFSLLSSLSSLSSLRHFSPHSCFHPQFSFSMAPATSPGTSRATTAKSKPGQTSRIIPVVPRIFERPATQVPKDQAPAAELDATEVVPAVPAVPAEKDHSPSSPEVIAELPTPSSVLLSSSPPSASQADSNGHPPAIPEVVTAPPAEGMLTPSNCNRDLWTDAD